MWDRRSLGGGGASSPQVPVPPGLKEARPAGALSHLRRCARAVRARKSLEGAVELVAHPPELAAISLCSPEVGGRRARAAPEGAGLLLRPFFILRPRGVEAVATPGLHSPSASMVAAAGWLPLLVTSFPQEAWGRLLVLAGTWGPVPCGAGAQAPICRPGVFLLTLLKLWDLEHALGFYVSGCSAPDFLMPWACVGADEGFFGVPIWRPAPADESFRPSGP